MTTEELRSELRATPWRPLRLHVSSGETFDIKHRNLCWVGLTSAKIGFPSPEDPESDVYARCTIVDLDRIIRLEPLNTANGGPAKS